MSRPSLAGQSSDTLNLSDFELVRNAKGEWLLIVTQAPEALLDDTTQALQASIDGSAIVIASSSENKPAAKMHLQNILSSQYISSLNADKPATLLFSVVDDDGTQQFSARVPMLWN